MQLSGVVDLDPDGKKAKERLFGFGASALTTTSIRATAGFMVGSCEVEYREEDGKWKILELHWC